MKRTAFVLLLVVSATALFATGATEARGRAGFDGDNIPPADAVFTSVELTGTIEMVDDHAVLTADGKTYLLAIPRIAWYTDDVADGTVVTITGNLVEGVTHDEVDFDGDGHITVQQVEIDGEVFAVGNQGGRGGMGGGYDDEERNGRYSSDENAESFGRGRSATDDDFDRQQMPRGRRS